MINVTKTPWPWFGGKSAAAPAVWDALGDPDHYAEPFAGTLAVLLRRPALCNRPYYSETVNDADGLLVNAFRGIQLQPDATAEAASWPVTEADLMARNLALVRWRGENNLERLMADPAFCDPRMAGWWIWGCSCWIGGGWCSGTGPWVVGADGRVTKRPKSGAGVSRQRPHLSDDGQGVNHAGAREPGVSAASPIWTPDDFHPMTMPQVRTWFAFLSARLRHVRILNGDWTRLVTNGALKTLPVRHGGVAGVFLDPPYADTAGRRDNIYASDSLDVAHAVHEWALRHGEDPQLRIVVAGFDGEDGGAFEAAGWRAVEWFRAGYLSGGMGNVGSTSQQHRERLWCSPHCLKPATHSQLSLFDHLNN